MDYDSIRQIILDLRGQSRRVARFAGHFFDGPFARQELLSALLWEYDPARIGSTRLIDYTAWLRYYGDVGTVVELEAAGERRATRMPYQVLVDLTAEPDAVIRVVQPVESYEMPDAIRKLTEPNLEVYRREKPRTFNGRVVRLSDFERTGVGRYEAAIAVATYWDQARTNLTIDLPLPSAGERRPLRERDLGEGGRLRPFSESMLLNSIGVSAIVGFRGRQWHFFCKLRRAEDAIAENMLATTSGVAELLPGQHVRDLLCYAEAEMIREFYNETGLSCEDVVRVVPLAFCRELIRGGKPQFMFFIEIREQDPKAYRAKFEKSTEGLYEFYDSWISNLTMHGRGVSYELAFNLSLALRFLQRERHQSGSPLHLTP